ncbi:hypothetical protein GCM10010991_30060 [Gemmobacter aquaticus]|jgi:predicted RNA-binding protein YlxR (DUF448 family)|uniref:YlxR domain-containing protein n=1 Tax=Gemmobacter aquaticus TaxID=490185 RepID=A0A917YLE5_9RHOB|nr:RNA-binding protein [Gemmobacter aquaticus]GGO36308.1 hypothetical protein GCM10010991_30060 [Gemmobacter aquaticus]
MTRGGQKETGEGPERRCIVSGEVGPKAGLIRFVAGPDGQVVPDVLGRLPGRGFWVTSTREALDRAAAKGLFSRAARTKVTTPAELADLIEGMLARRVVELISLTRKAGLAVTGYEKVKDWLVNGTATVLIQASDGSERGKSKLRPPEKTGLFIGCLTAQEIGLAFGREHAIHGALAAGGLSNRVVEEAARLAGLRGGAGQHDGGETAGEDTKTA